MPGQGRGRSRGEFESITRGRSVGANVIWRVDVETDEIERAADGLHVAGFDLWSVRAFTLEIPVGVLSFHEGGEEWGIAFASSAARGFDLLVALDHRHVDAGIFGQAYQSSAFGAGANGLNCQAVCED